MTAFENMIGESEIYHIGKYLQQCSHPFPFVKTVWESESEHHIESKADQPWPRWPCRCRSWDPRRSPARCRSRGWTPGGSGLLARWAGAPTLTVQWVWWLWLNIGNKKMHSQYCCCQPCRHITNKVLRQRISVKSVEGKDEEARQGGVGGVVPAI